MALEGMEFCLPRRKAQVELVICRTLRPSGRVETSKHEFQPELACDSADLTQRFNVHRLDWCLTDVACFVHCRFDMHFWGPGASEYSADRVPSRLQLALAQTRSTGKVRKKTLAMLVAGQHVLHVEAHVKSVAAAQDSFQSVKGCPSHDSVR